MVVLISHCRSLFPFCLCPRPPPAPSVLLRARGPSRPEYLPLLLIGRPNTRRTDGPDTPGTVVCVYLAAAAADGCPSLLVRGVFHAALAGELVMSKEGAGRPDRQREKTIATREEMAEFVPAMASRRKKGKAGWLPLRLGFSST